MWVARSPDLIHWGRARRPARRRGDWETGRVGAGPPPIRVPDGWLAIYHGNRHPTRPGEVGAYYGGALLLDPDDPARVLRRTAEPFFAPEADFEVAASSRTSSSRPGSSRTGDTLLVYYGAADACTAVVEFAG